MNRKISVFLLSLVLAVSCSVSVLASSFTDVKDPSWYSESVNYVVEKGYMAGMSETIFSPNTMITRAQLTQILYAAEGKPEAKGESTFSDVPSTGKWYSSAILWGVANSIVAGYPDKTFRPNQAVTREQLVSVMYKYAIYKKYAEQKDGGAMGLAGFPDGDKVADFARPGMLWAVQSGIISGTKIGLEPKGFATRAQMAVIIRAFMTKVAEPSSEGDEDEEQPVPSEKPDKPSPSVNPSTPDDGAAGDDSDSPKDEGTPSVGSSSEDETEFVSAD